MNKKTLFEILKDCPDETEILVAICPTPSRISAFAKISNVTEKNVRPLTLPTKISKDNVVLYLGDNLQQIIKEQDKEYEKASAVFE